MASPSLAARAAILGVPYQPGKQPDPLGVVKAIEALDAKAMATSAGAIVRDTLASLNAVTNPPAHQMGWVTGDATAANNGIYENAGSPSAPDWQRRADLLHGMIHMINVGAGTADAIVATSSLPLPTTPGAALLTVNIIAPNTGNVTINGKPLRTNSGNEIAAGGLTAGSIHAFLDLGNHFRLLSDQASAAIVAAAESFANAALAAVPNAFPADRTALKALDTNSITGAYLKEPGREGQFIWRTGDYSAEVAADTGEGRTIAATAVSPSVGAWVREDKRPYFATDFGVNGDGSNQSTALAAALAALPADGYAQLILPPGAIVLDDPLPVVSGKAVDIVGDQNTHIIPTYDGDVFKFRPSDILQSVSIRSISIRAGKANASDLCAIDVAWPTQLSWSGRTLFMKDVEILSSLTGADQYYWTNGIKLANAWNGYLENVSGVGRANTPDTSVTFITLGENCTDLTIIKPRGTFWTQFIAFGAYSEGVEIISPTSVLCSYGIRDAIGCLGTSILGGHINSVISNILFEGSQQARISHLLGYMAYAGNSANISMTDTQSCIVEGNMLVTTEDGVSGIKLNAINGCERNRICNNSGEGFDQTIWFGPGTEKNIAHGNTLFRSGSRYNPVFDQGTDNDVSRFSAALATTVTLSGGAPQEAIFKTLPDWVTAQPQCISGQENTGYLSMAYDRMNSDGDVARLLFRTFSGANIIAGDYDVTLHISG